MPNPELINENYYLRLHVPKDVATNAKGTTVAILSETRSWIGLADQW